MAAILFLAFSSDLIIITYYYYYHILLLLVVFVSDFSGVLLFHHVLSSVIPTPWTHMVLDVLPCYLIRLY